MHHPDFKLLDVPPTPATTLRRAQARAAGIRHSYTGNVDDVAGQSTYCAACGTLLIGRDWYALGQWHLSAQGCCAACGARLAGHFDPQPSRWGRRREPIVLSAEV